MTHLEPTTTPRTARSAARVLGFDLGTRTVAYGLLDVPRLGSARLLAYGQVDAHEDAIAAVLAEHHPELVAIETPMLFGARAGANMMALSRVCERVRLVATRAGVPTIERTSTAWRAALGVPQNRKRLPGSPTVDVRVERMLRMRVTGMPAPQRTCSDERDGMGIALAGALGWMGGERLDLAGGTARRKTGTRRAAVAARRA